MSPFAKGGSFILNELPRRKQRGIKNFKFCHSALDAESSPVFWIPASAGMTNSPQAAGNTTRRDLRIVIEKCKQYNAPLNIFIAVAGDP
jgi:hypothetical protein